MTVICSECGNPFTNSDPERDVCHQCELEATAEVHPELLGQAYDPVAMARRGDRDAFAMAALTGLLAYQGAAMKEEHRLNAARDAYAYADAMLQAREE